MKNNNKLSITVTILTLVVFALAANHGRGDTITVNFDKVDKHDDAEGLGAVGGANFVNGPFTSRSFTGGSKIKNASKRTITDVHIKLINPDKNKNSYTFDPKSTGGGAFPDAPQISKDGTEIDFTGGNIAPGEFFWALIPLSSDYPGGKAKYEGRLTGPTPTPTPPPPTPTPTPTPTPKPSPPRTYTGPGQTPTPTPQEHGMVPRQPGKTGETCAVLIAAGKIKVDTTGTGETIGHIADLKIRNLTDQPLTCTIAPMILESGSGKNQHYACPSGQTVALNPHQTKTVPMNGVCLNRNKPPVGKGVSGDLIINEANPSGPQNPNSHLPPTDAGKLLRICTAKYDAADQLQKSGALKNLPYHDPQKQKDIVVQWSTWCDPRISQITGAPPATKDDLKKVVYKQVTEQGQMSPGTKKKVDQGIDTIFEKVELTTAKAKDLEKPDPFANVQLTGEQGKGESSPLTQSPSPPP